MARWRLVSPHYINVEGTSWEQIEIDQMTGKQVRKSYPVPLLLDIKDPTVWNDNIVRNARGEVLGGDVIVAYKAMKHEPRDYLFTGEPTPDMIPMDDEAQAITAKLEPGWNASPDEDRSYAQRKIDQVNEDRAAMDAQASTVKVEGLGEILASMTEVMKQNAALIATLTSAKSAERRA